MIFQNRLPLTPQGIEWLENPDWPPDVWPWHCPYMRSKPEHADSFPVLIPIAEDPAFRFRFLVSWLINESAWDQLYREAQISHKEYQLVTDYCSQLSREYSLKVAPPLACGLDFEIEFDYCEWDTVWSRYPRFILSKFEEAGMKLNPTDPIDDIRSPWYNCPYALNMRAWRESQKPKPKPKRIVISESSENFPVETSQPQYEEESIG